MSTYIIDDRDPAVVYSPGWYQGGSGKEYNATTTYTDMAGCTATLTFQGISIGVYGTIRSSNGVRPPRTSYAIDGTTLSIYEPTLAPIAQHARFFQSGKLTNAKHTLVTSTLRDDVDIYLLDYLIIEVVEPRPGATATQTSSDYHPVRTPIIVGCTVAAVAVIILIIGILFFYLRRRKRNEPQSDNYTSFWVNPLPEPASNEPTVSVMPTHKGTTLSHSFTSVNQGSSHQYSVAPPQYLPPQYEFEGSTTGPSSSAGTSTQNAATPLKQALAQRDFVVRNDDNVRTSTIVDRDSG